jgi:hypothetical protein
MSNKFQRLKEEDSGGEEAFHPTQVFGSGYNPNALQQSPQARSPETSRKIDFEGNSQYGREQPTYFFGLEFNLGNEPAFREPATTTTAAPATIQVKTNTSHEDFPPPPPQSFFDSHEPPSPTSSSAHSKFFIRIFNFAHPV